MQKPKLWDLCIDLNIYNRVHSEIEKEKIQVVHNEIVHLKDLLIHLGIIEKYPRERCKNLNIIYRVQLCNWTQVLIAIEDSAACDRLYI